MVDDEFVQGAADRFIAWTVALGESDQDQGEVGGSLVSTHGTAPLDETEIPSSRADKQESL